MRRINFTAGGSGNFALPKYAVPREFETPEEAVARAIASKNGCVVAALRSDGYTNTMSQFSATIGYPIAGAISVVADVWFQIEGEK